MRTLNSSRPLVDSFSFKQFSHRWGLCIAEGNLIDSFSFNQFSHRWGLCIAEGNLVDSFSFKQFSHRWGLCIAEGNLVDSFFICSHADEDFVWTVQGNLLTLLKKISSDTDKDFVVWTVQGNLLILFCYQFWHRWGLWLNSSRQNRGLIFHLFSCRWGLCLNSSKQLVAHFSSVLTQMKTVWTVEGNLLTCFNIFLCRQWLFLNS